MVMAHLKIIQYDFNEIRISTNIRIMPYSYIRTNSYFVLPNFSTFVIYEFSFQTF